MNMKQFSHHGNLLDDFGDGNSLTELFNLQT